MGTARLRRNSTFSIVCGLTYLFGPQPYNTGWIVGDERRLAQARLADDAGEADQDNEHDT